jgi:hypothetical protein
MYHYICYLIPSILLLYGLIMLLSAYKKGNPAISTRSAITLKGSAKERSLYTTSKNKR